MEPESSRINMIFGDMLEPRDKGMSEILNAAEAGKDRHADNELIHSDHFLNLLILRFIGLPFELKLLFKC